jgi:HK97 family phage major capsid protein
MKPIHLKYLLGAALIVMMGFAVAGHPIVAPEVLGSLSLIGFVGDISLVEIKSLIDQQGEAWEAYKKTHDDLLKAKAEGKAVAELEAKLAKIGADIDRVSEVKAKLEALEQVLVKMQRAGMGGAGGDVDIATETKAFNAIRRSYADSKQIADVSDEDYAQYKSAFFSYVRKGKLEALSDVERKAMLAGDDSNGGYLLPPSTIGRIAKKIFELSPIRQIASVQNISTQALEGIFDTDESSYGWVGEVGARTTTTTPTIGRYRIEAFEMYADPKATQTLLDDAAIDVEAWLAAKVADKFARVEGAAFITGDGVSKPRGFASYTMTATGDATRTWGQIEKVKTGVNADFAASSPADKLYDLIGAFKTTYLQNAMWVTTREVITKIRKFKEATTNAYMWQPGLQAGQPDRLLGYPIVNAQDVAALATGSASLWLGDWAEAYQIVDRMGVRTLRDPYTDKPYVHFYSTKRVGGGVLNFEALKVLTFEA